MARPLTEYFGRVLASDVQDYNGSFEPIDFLMPGTEPPSVMLSGVEWIITNPPFGAKTIPFVLRAIDLAQVGVAMFVRAQWLEGCERYRKIFRPHPPTLVAHFSERVNLCRGRWDPDGSTATAYVWVVWLRRARRRAPYWIPPGCRKKFTRPDDRERFAA